jgi:uncharacterized protein (DUF362 family)/Pyruvate/2-oxoacid:ferredoxin oxidoreductase delta subunit
MRVSLVKCGDYERENVYAAMKALLDNLGGMGRFVKPGMRVFVKPNMLAKAEPSAAVTTHPEVVAAVARLAREAGAAEVMIGDCPGGFQSTKEESVRRTYEVCGYTGVAEREGARIVMHRRSVLRDVPGGVMTKSVEIVEEMAGADLLISVSKAKTHQLCAFTGAAKNLFGAIYGREKSRCHAVYSRPSSFNNFLIDVAEAVKPGLNIMDAVVGLEGPGPSAGSPRKLGALLASESPYALDAVAVQLIGWKQSDVLLLKIARERGLLPERPEDIETVGEKPVALQLRKPFLKPMISGFAAAWLEGFLPKGLREALRPRPVILPEKCVGCGECAAACPPRAMKIENKKAQIEYEKCIKCFCCQELCPEKAVEAKRGFIKKV